MTPLKKLFILSLAGTAVIVTSTLLGTGWLTEKVYQGIKSGIKKGQESRKRRMGLARERGVGMYDLNKPLAQPQDLYPDLELWYKGYRKRGASLADLKPLYYKLGYTFSYPEGDARITEYIHEDPNTFQELKPGDRRKEYSLTTNAKPWLIISDKQRPGPDDDVYLFDFPEGKKMLIRFRVVDRNEKPKISFGPLHGKMFMFGPQTGPAQILKLGKRTRTETGIPLEGNVSAEEITPSKHKWSQLKIIPFGQLSKELS